MIYQHNNGLLHCRLFCGLWIKQQAVFIYLKCEGGKEEKSLFSGRWFVSLGNDDIITIDFSFLLVLLSSLPSSFFYFYCWSGDVKFPATRVGHQPNGAEQTRGQLLYIVDTTERKEGGKTIMVQVASLVDWLWIDGPVGCREKERDDRRLVMIVAALVNGPSHDSWWSAEWWWLLFILLLSCELTAGYGLFL